MSLIFYLKYLSEQISVPLFPLWDFFIISSIFYMQLLLSFSPNLNNPNQGFGTFLDTMKRASLDLYYASLLTNHILVFVVFVIIYLLIKFSVFSYMALNWNGLRCEVSRII
jgi:hypothetical protein